MPKKRETKEVRRKYEFIKANHGERSVRMMCRLLDVAPSGYYAWLKKPLSNRSVEDVWLLVKINKFHQEFSRHGQKFLSLERIIRKIGIVTTIFHSSKLPSQAISAVTPFVAPDARAVAKAVDEIAKDTDRDYYMTAEEGKEYGIVDDILTKPEVEEEEELVIDEQAEPELIGKKEEDEDGE